MPFCSACGPITRREAEEVRGRDGILLVCSNCRRPLQATCAGPTLHDLPSLTDPRAKCRSCHRSVAELLAEAMA